MSDKKELKEIKTNVLENIFMNAKRKDIDVLREKYKDKELQNVEADNKPTEKFRSYMRERIETNGLKLKDVIFDADIDEKYGYKILNLEKVTAQRDIILRLCYAAKLNLEETQRALELYKIDRLYAKIPRDQVMMVLFNDRPGDIQDFNSELISKGEKPLRTTGKVK